VGQVVWIVNSFDAGEMYAEYLQARQVDVRRTSKPEEIFAGAIRAAPAAIVTDLVFRESAFNGLTFIRRLREQPIFQHTTILVLSGYVREDDRQAARQAGADRFLLKPLLPQELLTAVTAAFAAHARGERWTDQSPPRETDRRRLERRRMERRRRQRRALRRFD
jgi:DNA-binding response OmpR family regulator